MNGSPEIPLPRSSVAARRTCGEAADILRQLPKTEARRKSWKGRYSPKGTSRTLSKASTISPDPSMTTMEL